MLMMEQFLNTLLYSINILINKIIKIFYLKKYQIFYV